jgi:O-antigen/teichoic acid export membrane protein
VPTDVTDPEAHVMAPVGTEAPRQTSLAKGFASTLAATLAIPITTIGTSLIINNVMEESDRGVLAAVVAAFTLVMWICTLGQPFGVGYAIAEQGLAGQQARYLASRWALLGTAVGMVALWLLAPVILRDHPEAVPWLRILALALPLTTLGQLAEFALNGQRRFHWMAVGRWVNFGGRLIVVAMLWMVGSLTVLAVSLTTALSFVAGGLLCAVAVFRFRAQDRGRKLLPPDQPAQRESMRNYGFKAWIGTLALFANARLDQSVLINIVSDVQLAVYAVAVSVAEVPNAAALAVRDLIFTEAAARGDHTLIAKATRLTTAMMVAGVAVSWPVVGWLVPLVYSKYADSVPVIRVLLLGGVLLGGGAVLGSGLLALNRPGQRTIAEVAGVAVTVLGLIFVVPEHGIMGAAWTAVATYGATLVIATVMVWRASGLGPLQLLVVRPSDVTSIVAIVRRKLGR